MSREKSLAKPVRNSADVELSYEQYAPCCTDKTLGQTAGPHELVTTGHVDVLTVKFKTTGTSALATPDGTPCVASHVSHLKPRASHLTPRTSHLTPHTSSLTPHFSGHQGEKHKC